MSSVKPFEFKNLPRLTKAQADVLQAVSTYLSHRPFAPEFRDTVAELLGKLLKETVKLSPLEIRPTTASQVRGMIPDSGCFVLLGVAPTPSQILVDIDPGMSALTIERLLGGMGSGERIVRPLTEIEQGVLSYLILKVLGVFYQGWQQGRQVALTLNGFASKAEELESYVASDENYYLLGIRLGAGDHIGYARLFLPGSLISSITANLPQSGTGPDDLAYMRKTLMSLGEQPITAIVEAATQNLESDVIATLEVGDIIIIENHQLTLGASGSLERGSLFVRVGTGRNGGLRGQLINDEGHLKFELTDIIKQEHPLETSNMQDEESESPATEPTDNLAETEGLLRDVEAPVVIELGRLQLNTAQVVRLRAGQILRLPRNANDPVDLVVNNKLFARGELVEVDGELGVRLVHVTGAS